MKMLVPDSLSIKPLISLPFLSGNSILFFSEKIYPQGSRKGEIA